MVETEYMLQREAERKVHKEAIELLVGALYNVGNNLENPQAVRSYIFSILGEVRAMGVL